MARINFRRADELVYSRHTSPTTAIFVRAGEVDPRSKGVHLVRDEAETILAEVAAAKGVTLDLPIGTMIELPRAALTGHRIADAADFFSFGTNDLTQTTWGFSRDDVESSVFATYLEEGVFTVSPFETIDGDGVGRLVKIAAEEGFEEGPAHQARPEARGLRRARR
jgi:phosphoenolpyruvate synthase/pyruvate phosphate dikinase